MDMARAKISVVPPGAKGTIILTGLVGQVWAETVDAIKIRAGKTAETRALARKGLKNDFKVISGKSGFKLDNTENTCN